MRPVQKTTAPRMYSRYKDAKTDLIDNLGEYCSYCEERINEGLQVEHIQPKHPKGKEINRQRELDWDNFLLACPICNPTKSNKEFDLNEVYLPHRDNTYRTFIYKEDGRVLPNGEEPDINIDIAQNTLSWLGLDRTPASGATANDRRWLHRKTTYQKALEAKDNLKQQNTPQMRNCILELASASGHWSIWMHVFDDDIEMKRALIEHFPGTCHDCFNEHLAPIKRKGGLS